MDRLASTFTNTCTFAQAFGANGSPVYTEGKTLGHPGIDISCGYGTLIKSPVAMHTYNVIPNNPELLGPEGYTQVAGIVDTPLECFEWIIGHCDPIVGNDVDVQIGDPVATEANHGPVWSGGVEITLAMQQVGDKRGSHRHYQKRPLLKVPSTPGGTYLDTIHGYYQRNGSYFQVYAPANGYNGCVDWSLPLFNRDLFLGRQGYDVLLLQRAFVLAGIFNAADCIGQFGPKTMLAASQFQKMYGISPTLGFVGPKTRALLNSKYHQLV